VSWCFGDSVFQVPSSEGIPSQQHHEILAHAPIPQLGSTTWATPAKDIKRLARERERERDLQRHRKKNPLGIGETFARSFVEMCRSVLKRIPSNDICWVLTCAHKYNFQDIPTHVETISRTPTSGCMSGLSSYHTLALPGLRLAELQKGTQVHVAGTESFDVIGDLCSQGSGDWEMGCQTSEGFLQISAVCLVEPQLQHKSATDIATAHLTTSSTVTTQMRLDSDEVWQWKAMFILFGH